MGNVSVIEVSCPGCGAKLKAPDSLAGKKAKCKKCGAPFRIPGAPAGDSLGEPLALSALAMPAPPLPDDGGEVAMAEPVEAADDPLPLPVAPPAKPVAALASADPFDFSAPAAAPKSAFGAAKPVPKPVAPAPAPVPKPPPPAPAPAPVAKAPPKPTAPTKPTAKPKPEPLSLDDDEPAAPPPPKPSAPAAKAKPAPAAPAADNPFAFGAPDPVANDPFAFSGEPAEPARPAKAKRRDEPEADAPPPKKARKAVEDEDKPAPTKAKAKPKEEGGGGGGFNPFADFSGEPEAPAKANRRDDDEERPRKKGRGDDEDEPEKPRYQRGKADPGNLRKSMIRTGMIGGVALLLAVAAVVVYVRDKRKDAEEERVAQQKEEEKRKKDEAPPAPPPDPASPPKVDPKGPDPKPKDKNPDPKAKDKDPDPKPKDKEPLPPGARPTTAALPKLRPFTVGALPAAPVAVDQPRAGARLESPLTAIKRVFPPLDAKSGDALVLVQASAGFGGKGEKLALESYSPTGDRVPSARIEFDGDGSPVPIADVSTTAKGTFFLASNTGKLTVWALADKAKVAADLDPYADKPEHAKAGLAAAYFAADPGQVVTVSTGGAVLLYDLTARKAVSEFVPPNGVAGRVAQGLSVAKADKNESIVVAVSGVVYQVAAAPGLEVKRTHDLGGDVGRSLGLAVSGTPGRLLYVFETVPDKSGKKEKAVLGLPLGDDTKRVLHPIPAALGEPKGALWSNGTSGGVVTDKGVLWFDDDEGKFQPLVSTQTTGSALFYGDEKLFWFVIANPKAPAKSVLVALSVEFNDRADFQTSFPGKPLRAVRIDHTGLAK